MNRGTRTGTLAAIVLATTLGAAPSAEAGVIDWVKDKGKNVITYFLGCDPCTIDEKKPDEKPKVKPAPDTKRDEGRRAGGNRRITPAPDLNRFYDSDIIAHDVEKWCVPGKDYAMILPTEIKGPLRLNAGYKSVLVPHEQTPAHYWDIVRDGTITRTEINTLPLDADGKRRMDFPLNELLLDKNGVIKKKETRNFNIAAHDCYTPPKVICCEPAVPQVPEVPETPEIPGAPRDAARDARKEWTVGMGVLSDTTESAVWTTGRNPQRVPVEDIFRGTKTHVKFEYTTNNDLFAVYGASAHGTDNPDSGFWADCERYVDGKSLGAHAEIGLFNTKVTPYIVGGAEWKRVETGVSAGRFGNAVDMNYDTIPVHAGLGVLFGKQNGDNAKIAAEYVWQNMNIQNFGMSSTNDDRGDGVIEKMVMFTAAGQKFLANDHVRVYADGKYMMPQSQRATNPDEVILDSTASNGRIGFDYYFTPQRSGSWKLGLEGQIAIEDAKFPRDVNLNRTTTAGMVNIGYSW